MIREGIKVVVAADEFHEHLIGRLEHHDRRVDEYEERLRILEEEGASSGVTGSMIDTTRSTLTNHRRLVDYFNFLVEHDDMTADHLLSDHELRTLEFIR